MGSGVLEDWLAVKLPPVVLRVSAQDIARFAVAIGASDPAHFDRDSARACGYENVVAPDLFFLALRTGVFNVVPQDCLHEEGTSLRDIPPIDYITAMAGETKVILYRRFVADEPVVVSCRREKATRKDGRSGPLILVGLRYDYATQAGELLATEHFTRIFR